MTQNRSIFIGFAFFLMTISALSGCATAKDNAAATEGSIVPPLENTQDVPTSLVDCYRLQVGDEFDVKVYNHPELDEELIVRPDGKVSMLIAEDIAAAGLTPRELDLLLTEHCGRRIKDPHLAIVLRKFAGNRVYVGGEVHSPGQLYLEGPMTVLQSIYRAGGFKETAQPNSVLLLRDIGQARPAAYTLNLKDVQARGQGDAYLKPYDAIFVPKTFIAKADKFVDQYVNKIVPDNFIATFAWTYNLTPFLEVFNR